MAHCAGPKVDLLSRDIFSITETAWVANTRRLLVVFSQLPLAFPSICANFAIARWTSPASRVSRVKEYTITVTQDCSMKSIESSLHSIYLSFLIRIRPQTGSERQARNGDSPKTA